MKQADIEVLCIIYKTNDQSYIDLWSVARFTKQADIEVLCIIDKINDQSFGSIYSDFTNTQISDIHDIY